MRLAAAELIEAEASDREIAGRFRVSLDLLLHRLGWSVQVPARWAAERDEAVIAAWKQEAWPVIKGAAADLGVWSASKTSPARA